MKAALIVLFLITASSAWAGNEHGNGGDSFALEFVTLGRKLVEEVRRNPDPRIPESALVVAVETTDVVTQEALELRGIPVDAINYPLQKRIELSRSRWKDYDLRQKTSLVLHEYLGILGVNDARYEISGKYTDLTYPVAESVAAVQAENHSFSWQNVSLSVGASQGMFGGNMGKLYEPDNLGLSASLAFAINRNNSVRLSLGRSTFTQNSEPVGVVNMALLIAGASIQHHLTSNSYVRDQLGIDPYVFAGIDQVFRDQTFLSYYDQQKDSAFGIHAGLGASVLFLGKKAAFWAEAKGASIFFKDRYEQSYLAAGLNDTTGPLYAGSAGVKCFF